MTNTRTLVSGGSGNQVSIDDLGPGDYSHTPWMTPNADMGDPEVSPDGTRLAATFFYGDDTQMAFFAVSGDVRTELPPAQPEVQCSSSEGDAQHADPTWSPDSSGIAYHSKLGIEVGHFGSFGGGNCSIDRDWVLTATGSEPDWGPADPPAARYVPAGGGPAGPAGPGGGAGPSTPAAAALKLVGAPRTAKVKALRKGLVVEVRVTAAGKVTVKLGKVARGSFRAEGRGHREGAPLEGLQAPGGEAARPQAEADGRAGRRGDPHADREGPLRAAALSTRLGSRVDIRVSPSGRRKLLPTGAGSSASSSTSSIVMTGWNVIASRTSAGTSSRSPRLRSGRMTSVSPAACAASTFCLSAADRQHPALQRDLAGHADRVLDRAARQQRRERGGHRDAGARAVLRDRARRDVDVELAVLERVLVDAELRRRGRGRR